MIILAFRRPSPFSHQTTASSPSEHSPANTNRSLMPHEYQTSDCLALSIQQVFLCPSALTNFDTMFISTSIGAGVDRLHSSSSTTSFPHSKRRRCPSHHQPPLTPPHDRTKFTSDPAYAVMGWVETQGYIRIFTIDQNPEAHICVSQCLPHRIAKVKHTHTQAYDHSRMCLTNIGLDGELEGVDTAMYKGTPV